jgi:hypothetical protein
VTTDQLIAEITNFFRSSMNVGWVTTDQLIAEITKLLLSPTLLLKLVAVIDECWVGDNR